MGFVPMLLLVLGIGAAYSLWKAGHTTESKDVMVNVFVALMIVCSMVWVWKALG